MKVRGERRLRHIVHSQRRQTLAQITTQLNDGASHIVCNRTVQRWVSVAVDLYESAICSMLVIGLQVLPGQESTETGG